MAMSRSPEDSNGLQLEEAITAIGKATGDMTMLAKWTTPEIMKDLVSVLQGTVPSSVMNKYRTRIIAQIVNGGGST